MAKKKHSFLKDVSSHRAVHKQHFVCQKHNMVFVEGFQCPSCDKTKVRSIFDEWEPSVEQGWDESQDESEPVILSMVAAVAGEKIPKPTSYRLVTCPLHQLQYLEGLSECPECKHGAA